MATTTEVSLQLAEWIFSFNDRPALRLQDEAVCKQLWRHFCTVATAGSNQSSNDALIPVALQQRLRDILPIAGNGNSDDDGNYPPIVWLPRYASALLIQSVSATESSLRLVGLDGWTIHVHSSTVQGREYTARVPDISQSTVAVLEVGLVDTDCLDENLHNF